MSQEQVSDLPTEGLEPSRGHSEAQSLTNSIKRLVLGALETERKTLKHVKWLVLKCRMVRTSSSQPSKN